MKKSIIVRNVSKCYKLYDNTTDRLKEALSVSKKKFHKNFLANENISFEIKKGEVVGIIGKNGSGKSTLLKLISNVLTPSEGNIIVNGEIAALLELGAGFNPEMTGIENLYLASSIAGIKQKDIEKKIEKIINFAELGEFIRQPIKTYSSGMKARLAFAFAIHTDAEIVIIDEALSVGDAAFVRKCYAKIEQMCASQNTTVLFVSHSGGAIKQLCDRVLLLHQGKLILDGDPKKIINLYEKYMNNTKVDISVLQKEYKELCSEEKTPTKKLLSQSFYNPKLLSTSTVELPQNGAKIFDIKLLDKENKQVNIISKKQYYTYQYSVQYFKDMENVNVAMRIKDIKGIILSGSTQKIKKVIKGKVYTVRFGFKNILNPGEYFFNCGTNKNEYGEFIMLHRIIDNYMFKVISDIKDDPSKGIIDFNFKADIQ